MSAPPPPVPTLVGQLGADYVALVRHATGSLPTVAHDPDWHSACIAGPAAGGRVPWQPVPMDRPPDFSRLSHALDVPVHGDLPRFFGTAWSASLPVRFEDNDLELLQLWNDRDFEHLIGNLIGHALEKKRVRQPLTLFFALVDDDRFLSLDNASGEVFLETVGLRKPLLVTPTLADFLQRLTPILPA